MLKFITGGAGSGKSYEMMKRISAAVAKGRDVIAVVPDQFNFEYNRLLYESMGMEEFNNMEIVSFSRLARYIFIKHGGVQGSYADDTVKSIIMSRAIKELARENTLSYYGRQVRKRTFTNDALEFVKIFAINGTDPAELSASADTLSDTLSAKVKDISLILNSYDRLLKNAGFKDNSTDISVAARIAAENNYFRGKSIFIDEFKSFTPDETEMLRAMIADADECTLCLTTENHSIKEGSVFEVSDRTIHRLSGFTDEYETTHLTENYRFSSPELEFLSKNILRPVRGEYSGKAEAVKVFQAEDCYAEADYVCAEIHRLVSECGYDYSDIVIAARNKEYYSSVIEAACQRYRIPLYSAENRNASFHALIVFLRTAVKIASSGKFRTEDILRYAKTGYPGLSYTEINTLEDYCYKWSVEGKLWLEPFTADDKKCAEDVRLKLIAPLVSLKKKLACGEAEGMCCAISDFLADTKASVHIIRLIEDAEKNGEDSVRILSLKRNLKQLWDSLCQVLHSMYRTLGNGKLTPQEFADIFDTAAAGITLSAPPQTTNSVHFNAVHLSRFSNPKAVFILGVNDGVLPYAARASHLLTERDISELNRMKIAISGSVEEKTREERFAAYNALSSASERIYITYPTSEISGSPLYPSIIIKQLCNMFGQENIMLDSAKVGLFHYCTNERSGYYSYVQNFKKDSEDISSLEKALIEHRHENEERFKFLKNPVYSSCRLDPATSSKLFTKDIKLSASRFEDFNKCPFMYLCKSGLELYPRNKIEYNPQSRGNIIHYCMEKVLSRFADDFTAKTQDQIAAAVEDAFTEYYNSDKIGGSYGKSERFEAAYSRLKKTATRLLLRIQDEFRNSSFHPTGFEYTFSDKAGSDEPSLRLSFTAPDGSICNVVFNGTIDRIDTAQIPDPENAEKPAKNYIRVVDYKTGSKEFSLTDVANGLNMQMLLYLFAVTDSTNGAVGGSYHGLDPAGILYMPSRDPKLSDKFSTKPEEQEIRKICNETLRMRGLILDDKSVICAMDETITAALNNKDRTEDSDYIPVSVSAGEISASEDIIDRKKFDQLRKYCYDSLIDAASKIYNGEFDADPLAKKVLTGYEPCIYCDYKTLCSNYPDIKKMHSGYNKSQIDDVLFPDDDDDTSKGDDN